MANKPLILIIDDEKDIRDIVKMKLEANGFEVKEAADGNSGLELVRGLKPDIILLDVVMPKMDGVAVLLKLKSDERTRNIRIYLFTGKGDPRPEIVEINRRFAKESGAVDFIRKEIDLDELVAKLQNTIREIKQSKYPVN
jgi:two-component system alkaline phosphatase synthesis response regulator PhoP